MSVSPNQIQIAEIEIKSAKKKKVDWSKFVGIIKLKDDPLKLQKKWRNEWR